MNGMNLNAQGPGGFQQFQGGFGQVDQGPLDSQMNKPAAAHDVFGSGPPMVGPTASSTPFDGGADSNPQPGMPMG